MKVSSVSRLFFPPLLRTTKSRLTNCLLSIQNHKHEVKVSSASRLFFPTSSKIHKEQVGESLTFFSKPQAWSESFVLLLTFNCSPASWPSGETVKVSQYWLLAIWETSELDSEKTWWTNLRISFGNKGSIFYNAEISITFKPKIRQLRLNFRILQTSVMLKWCFS